MHTGGLGIKIPSWRVVDIDAAADWHRAEVMKEVYDKLGSEPLRRKVTNVVIVTGGSGMLGHSLIPKLFKEGYS